MKRGAPRRLPVDGLNRKKLLTPFEPDPSIHTEPPLLAFACLLSSTLSVPGRCHRIKTPNTLEARFDLPILGSLDGFTEVHLDSSRANMPLMHKAVWHLLNHIEFVARRHAHKDLNISLDRKVKIEKKDELLTWNKPLFPCCGWSP